MQLFRSSVKLNHVIQLLLLFLFVVNVAESLFAPVLSIFIVGSIAGATLKTVGFCVAIYSVAKSIIQVPLAKWIDRQKNEQQGFHIMMLGSTLGIVYSLGFMFISSVGALYALSVVGGVAGAFLMAAYYSMFAKHTDKGAEGFEWSLFSVGGLTISSALGAAAGGVLAEVIGFQALFIVAAVLGAIATVLLLLLGPYLKPRKNK